MTRTIGAALRGVLFLAVLTVPFAFAGSAFAVVNFTSSQITSPADVSFPQFNVNTPNTIHVAGTTSGGTSNADLVCFYGTTSKVLMSNVTVTSNAFSADVPLAP